jgi:hypothetical protein
MIQKLNSVDQYCCLFHIVHQHTQVLLSKEATAVYVWVPSCIAPQQLDRTADLAPHCRTAARRWRKSAARHNAGVVDGGKNDAGYSAAMADATAPRASATSAVAHLDPRLLLQQCSIMMAEQQQQQQRTTTTTAHQDGHDVLLSTTRSTPAISPPQPHGTRRADDGQAEWYYQSDGNGEPQQCTGGELRELLVRGEVRGSTLVWCEGMEGGWVKLRTAKGWQFEVGGVSQGPDATEGGYRDLYYQLDDEDDGVGTEWVELEDVPDLLSTGVINDDSLVWSEGMDGWAAFSEVRGMFDWQSAGISEDDLILATLACVVSDTSDSEAGEPFEQQPEPEQAFSLAFPSPGCDEEDEPPKQAAAEKLQEAETDAASMEDWSERQVQEWLGTLVELPEAKRRVAQQALLTEKFNGEPAVFILKPAHID